MERREFELPIADRQFLDNYGLPWEAILDKSQWVLIHHLLLPKGYTEESVTAAILVTVGYPDAPLDMAYFYPAISRRDGQPIGATNSNVQIDGEMFQRWSRHRTAQNPWKPGIDNLESHTILIEDWLEREFEK